ncbi:MAG: HlyD family secretion protein [Bacillota bacterium]|jgi:HlyD family secretion protein
MGRMLLVALLALLLTGCQEGGLTASGTIEATQVELATEVAGRVAVVAVHEGERVAEGALLVRLDQSELSLQHQQAIASQKIAEAKLQEAIAGSRPQQLREAEEAVAQALAVRDQAASDLADLQALWAEGAVAENTLAQEKTRYETAEAAYQAALAKQDLLVAGARDETIAALKAQVDLARAAADLAALRLQRTQIIAPAAGTILNCFVAVGEYVLPGQPVATIANLEHLWLRVYVAESDLGLVSVGQEVTVKVDSFPAEGFHGRVTRIADQAEFTPRNVQTKKERVTTVYEVRVELEQDERLRPGMPADVEFHLATSAEDA